MTNEHRLFKTVRKERYRSVVEIIMKSIFP